jgi:hypothetical protein
MCLPTWGYLIARNQQGGRDGLGWFAGTAHLELRPLQQCVRLGICESNDEFLRNIGTYGLHKFVSKATAMRQLSKHRSQHVRAFGTLPFHRCLEKWFHTSHPSRQLQEHRPRMRVKECELGGEGAVNNESGRHGGSHEAISLSTTGSQELHALFPLQPKSFATGASAI